MNVFTDRARQAVIEILEVFRRGELPHVLAELVLGSDEPIPCHRWSWHNRLLVHLHGHADARGHRRWRRAGRSVREGEQPLVVLVPRQEYWRVYRDHFLVGYRDAGVFGYSQTEGEPVPYEKRKRTLDVVSLLAVARAWKLAASMARLPPRVLGDLDREDIRRDEQGVAAWAPHLVRLADLKLPCGGKPVSLEWATVSLGESVLLACLGEPGPGGCGDTLAELEADQKDGFDGFLWTCLEVIERACACAALILETAAGLAGGEAERRPA